MAGSDKARLLERIEKTAAEHHKRGTVQWTISEIMHWVTILASFLAALSATAGWLTGIALAIIAGLPGLVVLAQGRFYPEQRAWWHYRYVTELQGLYRQLRYEKASLQSTSANLLKLQTGMSKSFPGRQTEAGASSRTQ